MDSKQRASLRSQANQLDTILVVGKSGVGDTMKAALDTALTARELVKGRVLESSPLTARECAALLAETSGAEVVQVIGSKFVLYRVNPKLHEQKKAPSTGHVYGRSKYDKERAREARVERSETGVRSATSAGAGKTFRSSTSASVGKSFHSGSSASAGKSFRSGSSVSAGKSFRSGSSVSAGKSFRSGSSTSAGKSFRSGSSASGGKSFRSGRPSRPSGSGHTGQRSPS